MCKSLKWAITIVAAVVAVTAAVFAVIIFQEELMRGFAKVKKLVGIKGKDAEYADFADV